MSWHCLPGLVEEYSGESYSGGEPCAPLKSTPSVGRCYSKGRWMDAYRSFLYGTTLEPSAEQHGEGLSMSSAAVFHARTSASQTQKTAMASKENAADCGQKCSEWFAKYDQETSLLKTRQRCLFVGLEQSLEIWPQLGLMHGGECFLLVKPERHTHVKDCSSIPTPLATDWKGGTDKVQKRNKKQRTHQFRHWCKIKHGLTYPIPEHSEAMLGFPIGWTDLKPLATDKFQQWLDSHGVC